MDLEPKEGGIQSSAFSDKPPTFSSLGLNDVKLKIEFLPYNKRLRSVACRREL